MNKQNGLTLGVALDSFKNEKQHGKLGLEETLFKIAELNIGPAIEIDVIQSLPGYPQVSDEFAKRFRDLLDAYGLFPSCLRANIDPSHSTTPDEILESVREQIVTAQKLGFPTVGFQMLFAPDLLEKLSDLAAKAGVHIACELRPPLAMDNPQVIELLEFLRKNQSTALGIIPDFGCTMTAVPEGFWNQLRKAGAPDGLIQSAMRIWSSPEPIHIKTGRLADACRSVYAPAAVSNLVNKSLTMVGRVSVETWREVLPYVHHIRGTFYDVTTSYMIEPYVPYPELISLLKEVKYTGTLSAIWEGQAFTEEPVGFQQVQAWQVMCKRLLAN